MFEYQLIDYRTPELRGSEQRGVLDELEGEFSEMGADGWRVSQVVGALTDERVLVIFERAKG